MRSGEVKREEIENNSVRVRNKQDSQDEQQWE